MVEPPTEALESAGDQYRTSGHNDVEMVDGGADDVEVVLDDSANAASENVTNVSNELAGVVQTAHPQREFG